MIRIRLARPAGEAGEPGHEEVLWEPWRYRDTVSSAGLTTVEGIESARAFFVDGDGVTRVASEPVLRDLLTRSYFWRRAWLFRDREKALLRLGPAQDDAVSVRLDVLGGNTLTLSFSGKDGRLLSARAPRFHLEFQSPDAIPRPLRSGIGRSRARSSGPACRRAACRAPRSAGDGRGSRSRRRSFRTRARAELLVVDARISGVAGASGDRRRGRRADRPLPAARGAASAEVRDGRLRPADRRRGDARSRRGVVAFALRAGLRRRARRSRRGRRRAASSAKRSSSSTPSGAVSASTTRRRGSRRRASSGSSSTTTTTAPSPRSAAAPRTCG